MVAPFLIFCLISRPDSFRLQRAEKEKDGLNKIALYELGRVYMRETGVSNYHIGTSIIKTFASFGAGFKRIIFF